jgi:hypothetical protein
MKQSFNKLGSLHIKPNWRYDALYNPLKYNLQDFISRPEDNSGCLKRSLTDESSYEVNSVIPQSLADCISLLNEEDKSLIRDYWRIYLKKNKIKHLTIISSDKPSWNVKNINNISDGYLRKAVNHISNIEYNDYIEKALVLANSKDHQEIFRIIGYAIYAKMADKEIAKRWNMTLGQAKAIRKLFFDFSHFPKDRIANFAYLRQLTNIGLFSDVDFAFYKRIFELGELGLRAQLDFYSLSEAEKKQIETYLGSSAIANTFNLNFSIKNQKDAVAYGQAISNLANYYIKNAEVSYFGAKIRNLDSCTKRIDGSMLSGDSDKTPLDLELLKLLELNSLQDVPIVYKTLDDLKK